VRRTELDAYLADLRRTRAPAARARLLDALRQAMAEPWFDASDYASVQEACSASGVIEPGWSPGTLGIGEAWLTVYRPALAQAAVVRLVVEDRRRHDLRGALKHEVENALAALQAVAGSACRRLPAELGPGCVALEASGLTLEVEGGSLGVAVCAAALSRALDRPARAGVAASAAVSLDGTLSPVAFLDAKLRALRLARPDVTRFLVAAGQKFSRESAEGIQVIPCHTLTEALRELGLDPAELGAMSLAEYRRRAGELEHIDGRTHSLAGWLEQARQALEIASALESHRDFRSAQHCRTWATLFAIHGGDPDLASDLLAQVDAAQLPRKLAAWKTIVEASHLIARNPVEAVERGEAAVSLAQALPDEDREDLLGRAYGTLGRALMHSGRLGEAEVTLRSGAAHHREHSPWEEPRSLCYLAQCLRLSERYEEARSTAVEAIASTDDDKARLFLELERGRALLALGRPLEALEAFEHIAARQELDSDYPGIAALRGLAAAHRAIGDAEKAAQELRRCIGVAQGQKPGSPVRAIALMAVGDLLVATPRDSWPPELVALWQSEFPATLEPEAIGARVLAQVY
jgi:tetratricopeptide (TPR) repeat protein